MLEQHKALGPSSAAAAREASGSAHQSGGAQARQGSAAANAIQRPPTTTSLEERFKGCMLGLAIGDAVAVARGSFRPSSLAELNALLGGRHGSLDVQFKSGKGLQTEVLCGLHEIAIGGWSHATASSIATAQSLGHCKALDMCDLMMRLLQMYRTGRGSCLPGHIGGVDKASVESFEAFERTSHFQAGAVYGCSSLHGVSSGALARVAPVVLFRCADAQEAIQAAAHNTRATHDLVATIDASRYMAAILCAILQSTADALTTKAQVCHIGSSTAVDGL
jgi:ADP-ribosyl-[dinitrogen reductase] hydrolase